MRSSFHRLPLLVAAMLLIATFASAQTGKIGGKVTDQQGGVLP
ncbi:MAG: hypothetical protein ACRD21_14430 [Vicinamibacteria bacterium]